jgi:hypothetical protein
MISMGGSVGSNLLAVLRTTVLLLTFQLSKKEFDELDSRHLAFGLVCTWLVGMGRWWDDPGANLLQHLGLGSVIYRVPLLSRTYHLSPEPLA